MKWETVKDILKYMLGIITSICIFTFIFGYIFTIYVDKFSDVGKEARKKAYVTYTQMGLPNGVVLNEIDDYNRNLCNNLTIWCNYDKSLTNETEIKLYYEKKLHENGWEKMPYGEYRRNQTQWFYLKVYDNGVMIKIREYAFPFFSDGPEWYWPWRIFIAMWIIQLAGNAIWHISDWLKKD